MLHHLLEAISLGHGPTLQIHKLEAFLEDITTDKLLSQHMEFPPVRFISKPALIIDLSNEVSECLEVHRLINLLNIVEITFDTVWVGCAVDDLLDYPHGVLILHLGKLVGDIPAHTAEFTTI